MNVSDLIGALARYAVERGLAQREDQTWLINRLLEAMVLDEYAPSGEATPQTLPEILAGLVENAAARGLCPEGITAQDLFDTQLMGLLTPPPREVQARFAAEYQRSPKAATDWYYRFSQDTNYIRADRIARDLKWVYPSAYGDLDITINLSKPEKDPRAIAALRAAPQRSYPKCQLCPENEGYAGRLDHPARQNHRIIPLTLAGERWFLQYSPYVYYPEHCIVLNAQHVPMVIDRRAFEKLLEFVTLFPHYFVGSNADLPIVGGSILTHEHFQGGGYTFPMARAEMETPLTFRGFAGVTAGILRWPMSVIRLRGQDKRELAALAEKILRRWRGYSDPSCQIFAQTQGQPHNTITPIARRRGADYELDLALRNNRTTPEYPLGLFHPHPDKHHIKKENIGLIEVMGLAVLPARLKTELQAVRDVLLSGGDLTAQEATAKHAPWAQALLSRHHFTAENAMSILQQETGRVFAAVLEDAGVYKRDLQGQAGFLALIDAINRYS